MNVALSPSLRRRLARDLPRIVIAGGPKTGKTTLTSALAPAFAGTVLHTDDIIGEFDWGDDSIEVARWFDETDAPWIVEGVTTARALRKWFGAHPDRADRPADVVVWCATPKVRRNPRQDALAKGTEKIWSAVVLELLKRGIPVENA